MDALWTIPNAVAVTAGLIAAWTDVWRFKVYNLLTIPLALTGLAYHTATGGLDGLWQSGTGFLFGLGVLLIPYALGGMGGGDVKLMAGIGAWLAMPQTFFVFVATGLAAGACAVMMIAVQANLAEAWGHVLITWCRLTSFPGFSAGAERGLVDDAPPESDSVRFERVGGGAPVPRRRVIPFGAMVALGTVAALLGADWLQSL